MVATARTSSGREADHKAAYARHSRRAHIAAYILVLGLVLEIVNAVIWYHGAETLAAIVAISLIVGGAWGEIFFENKAREAGDDQLLLYEARAAEANALAQVAQRETEQLRAQNLALQKALQSRHPAEASDTVVTV